MWSREQGLLENQNTLMLPTWDSVFLLIFLFSENSYFINISWRPLQVYYCIFLFYANWSSHDSPVLLCFLLCCRIYYFHWVFFTCLHLPSLTTKWSNLMTLFKFAEGKVMWNGFGLPSWIKKLHIKTHFHGNN